MWSNRSAGMPAGWDKVRRRVLRGSSVCYLCNKPGADEVDHLIPRHKGGSDEESNLRPVHRFCHAKKSSAEGHARKRALRAARFRPEGRHPGSL
jgi:5-methylcytosine-specific restriction endonuclease McrA